MHLLTLLPNDKAIFKMRTGMAICIDKLHLFSYMPNWPQSVVCKMFLISERIKKEIFTSGSHIFA